MDNRTRRAINAIDEIKQLNNELQDVNNKLQKLAVNEVDHELLSAVSRRRWVIKRLGFLEWSLKSEEEKKKSRLDKLELTRKYAEKYPEDVEKKYKYNMLFFELISLINEMMLDPGRDETWIMLLKLLKLLIDTNDFVYIREECYTQIELVMQILTKQGGANNRVVRLLDIFVELHSMSLQTVGGKKS
ncbi:MAG: hypothetical protein ICV83_12285 [Cytophagales bacterium]|nr:hypothetical protein [Cytophagales bacterium]